MEDIQAQFQMLDSFVKEYSLKVFEKIEDNKEMNIKGKLAFRIVNITEQNNILIGEIELINELEIMIKEECKGTIKIIMGGLFQYSNKNEKEKFEEMLKINGTTTLSHLIRTYIYTNTAISGMPTIITPMINFMEFFKEQENEEKNKTT